MANLDCLNGLVALSNVDFPCFTDTRPADYNESTSGYSLTDPEFGAGFLQTCEMAGWTVLQQALAAAISAFKTDVSLAIRNYHDSIVVPLDGYIGQLKSAGVSTPSLNWNGHQISPVRRKGLKLVIQGFYLGMDTSGTYTLNVTSNNPEFTAVTPIPHTVTGGSFVKKTLAANARIELPFYANGVSDLQYLIGYDNQGNLPLFNGFYCCGNKPGYRSYFDATGFQATSATGDNKITSSNANGLVLDAYLTCEELEWICNLYAVGGLQTLDLCARMIQAKGSAVAIGIMLNNPTFNLCGLYNQEFLIQRMNFLNSKYNSDVQWLGQNVPKGSTDCFTCKQEDTMTFSPILN